LSYTRTSNTSQVDNIVIQHQIFVKRLAPKQRVFDP